MKRTFSTAGIIASIAIIGATGTMQAGVVSGRIIADGKGVAGVPVSDGYTIVTTDKAGRYTLETDKKLGYIFYTLPAGYEPDTLKAACEPAIWA